MFRILRLINRKSCRKCSCIGAAPVLVSLFLLLASQAFASPGDMAFGTRSRSLGTAGVASAELPEDIFTNPAAAASRGAAGLEIGYASLFGVSEVTDNDFSVVIPLKSFGVAADWHQRSLHGLYHEDRISLITGFSIAPGGPWPSIDVGAGVSTIFTEIFGASDFHASPSPYFDLDAGLRIDFSGVSVGASCFNILSGNYSMLEKNGIPFDIPRIINIGALWKIKENQEGGAVLLTDFRSEGGGTFFPAAGLDFSMFNIIHGRLGVYRGKFSFGFGLVSRRVEADFSLSHSDNPGDTYRFSILFPFRSGK